MSNLMLGLLTAALSGAAIAGPNCAIPETQWMKEADLRARVEAQGIRIRQFKVSAGRCYEIYGDDRRGRKVEIYFNPASGAELVRK